MNQFAKSTAFGFLVIFTFVFLNHSIKGQTLLNETAPKFNVLAGTGISGSWQLNRAESDDPLQKMREVTRSKADLSATAENSNISKLPPLTTSFFHPDSLILVAGSNGELTINEVYKEIVQTRTIFVDGKTRTFKLNPSANYTVTAFGADGKTIIETVSPRGNKMIETYEIAAGGKKLKITIGVETAEGNELLTLLRTFDRTTLDIFPNEDGEIQ